LWLVQNGVPFDVAFSLSPLTRKAWGIKFQMMQGRKFNVNTLQFEDPKEG